MNPLLCPSLTPGTQERRRQLEAWLAEYEGKGYLFQISPGLSYQLERYRRELEGAPQWWQEPKHTRESGSQVVQRKHLPPEEKAALEREKLAKWQGA